jgi:hypothetical protein
MPSALEKAYSSLAVEWIPLVPDECLVCISEQSARKRVLIERPLYTSNFVQQSLSEAGFRPQARTG